MAKGDIIMVSQRELKLLHVIHKVLEGAITQATAAALVSISERQIRRLVKRIRIEGGEGILHKSRGKESSRRLPGKLKDRVVDLYRRKYTGFGPTFAAEKLAEIDKVGISDETLRKWLLESGQWVRGRKGKAHRQWRERRHHHGELLQMDGSHHDWFEGRGPKCVLMGMIDDATGKIYGQFHAYEGTLPAIACFKGYIQKYGIPLAVYLDRHTTYKSPTKVTIEEEIAGVCPLSEFGRAMAEFEVEMIYAHSPQAKGRIERLFQTLQDRLVKEMRLLGISSIQSANKFLKTYLSKFNKQFSVKPANEADLHRAVPEMLDLDKVLCIRTPHALRNDFTVAHEKKLYQVESAVQTDTVVVEEKIDGSLVISYKGKQLKIREILERPEKATPRKRKYRGWKSGAKRQIIPIERLLWNDGAMGESSPASRQSHAA